MIYKPFIEKKEKLKADNMCEIFLFLIFARLFR